MNLEKSKLKISDLDETCDINYLKVIVLSPMKRRIITTKAGESVNLSEILVGDESSDIVIKAWRNYSKLFENVNVGDMLELHKFQFLSDDYGNCLNVKSYSSITNLK